MADIEAGLPVRSKQDVDERLQSKIVDYTNPALGQTVDSDGDAHVKAKLRDDAGNPFGTETNPVFVTNTDNPNPEIHNFSTASAVVKAASSDHSYSPSGSGAKIHGLHLSASGYAKFEVKFGTTASEVLTYVYFNSVAQPTLDIKFPKPITLADGTDTMIITKTNLDNQAQDLYSTIIGEEF